MPKPGKVGFARGFMVDQRALELVAVFLAVLIPTALIALSLTDAAASVGPPDAFGDGAQGEATAGAAWAIAEVFVAIGILVAAFVYRKLPEWAQELVVTNLGILVLMWFGANAQSAGYFGVYAGSIVALYTAYKVTDEFGVYWALNNVFCVLFAIAGGLMLGMLFGVPGMILAIVGLTIYDHVFANQKKWMFTLGETILKARLPAIFIRPAAWRMQWDELLESFGMTDEDEESDDEDDGSWGLGTADLMIPAGFVAAVATAPAGVVATFGPVALAAVAVGVLVACFRLRWEMETRGSGAGLPALSAGALVPYVAIVALAAVV